MTGRYDKRPSSSRKGTNNGSSGTEANIVPCLEMDWLRIRLKEIGKSGADLGRTLGIPKSRVYEMFRGERRLQPEEVRPTARLLGWTDAVLLARLEGRPETPDGPAAARSEIGEIASLPLGAPALAPLVMYRTVPGERDRTGGFMVVKEQTGSVVRPEFLRGSAKAFSAKVLDDTNRPAYRARDVILVDPDDVPLEGDDCLFTNELSPAPGQHAVIGCLVSSTGDRWVIRQYAVEEPLILPKAEYAFAWPIVGRYNRR